MKRMSGLYTRGVLVALAILGAAIAFVMLAIVPLLQSGRQLDERYRETLRSIEEQEILQTLLRGLRDRDGPEPAAEFDVPRSGLAWRQIDTLYALFGAMAKDRRLQLRAVTPHVQSLDRTRGVFPVTVSAEGRFADFRDFLVAVIRLPQLQRIERLQIEELARGERLTLELWLFLQKESRNVRS